MTASIFSHASALRRAADAALSAASVTRRPSSAWRRAAARMPEVTVPMRAARFRCRPFFNRPSLIDRHAVAQQVAGDEPAVDFAGAFVDAPRAAGARHVFERHVLGNAHAAEELDRAIGDTGDHLGALEL